MGFDELFEPDGGKGFDVDPQGIVEDIDCDALDDQAEELSFALCKNLREVYFDDEFMAKNPKLKKRLDAELDSLRVLIKMRKSDEKIHDLCLRSIGMNSNNASLYSSLAKIQGTLLNIQKQMDETIKNINTLLKNVQLELNFDHNNAEQQESELINEQGNRTSRGSKDFINEMNAQLDSTSQV